MCQAVRPATKKGRPREVLCLFQADPGTIGEVHEVGIDTREGVQRLGASAAEFLEREVASLLGELPAPTRKTPRAKVEAKKAAPARDIAVQALLGAAMLRGLSLGQRSPALKGWKGSGGKKLHVSRRDSEDGGVEVNEEVHQVDGVVSRLESQITVRGSELDELLGGIGPAIKRELRSRLGDPARGRDNKKGDGEWKWKTPELYATAWWRISKIEKGPKAFETVLVSRIFIARWG